MRVNRDSIYYWKCDSPQSDREKRQSFFQDKYDRPELAGSVRAACRSVFGSDPDALRPLRVDGNHVNFVIGHGGTDYLFRADDGSGDDAYMLAESRLMELAAARGVPVPRVHHVDVSCTTAPFRFQLMDYVAAPSLNAHHRDGTLDTDAVAFQLGRVLCCLHGIALPGFGFIDVERLAREGTVCGLDSGYPAYFNRRLDEHLGYLVQHDLVSAAAAAEIRSLLERHAPRLVRRQGVLVHRDPALWNVLGTPDRVTAIIDWDDAVAGDPADDLGILACFYDEAFMNRVMAGYAGDTGLTDDFRCRMALHTLRNMLWKTKLRHALGYFEKGGDFFLNLPGVQEPLKTFTLHKLEQSMADVRSFDTP